MKFRKRVTASVLTAALLCTSAGSVPVYGAPAGADVDETMYVNLDYYGKTTKVNVVKGVNLNGLGKITDYGNYINVENMSTSDAPVLGDGSVTWNRKVRMAVFITSVPWTMNRWYFHGILMCPIS